MAPRPPRDPHKVGSFSELRSHYLELWEELDECRRMKGATNEVLRTRTGEARGTKAELEKAKRELTVTLTKTQKIKDENTSSAKYAAGAGTVMVIVYEFVKTVPGGWGHYEDFFNHEIVYSTMQVMLGILLAWAVRPLR